jgi:hypothetical protein
MEAIPCISWSGCRGSRSLLSAAAIGIVNVVMQRRESIVEREVWRPGHPIVIAWILRRFLPSKGSDAAARCDRLVSEIWTSTKGQRRVPRLRHVAKLTNLTS